MFDYAKNIWENICYIECIFIYQIQLIIPHPKKMRHILKKPIKYFSSSKKMYYYSYLFILYDMNKGIKLITLIYVSSLISNLIKNTIQHRRPYQMYNWIKSDSQKLMSYSLPSRSVQTAIIVYYTIFSELKIPYIANILCSLIIISRILRGLHFIHDIVIAIFLGTLLRNLFI